MLRKVKPAKHVEIPALVMEATEIMQVHPNRVTDDQARAACEEGTISQDQYDALMDFIEARSAN
jgi:hypothetical protein